MDETRKRAYRYLLYRAMLDIHPVGWMPLGFFHLLNPFARRGVVARVRRAGAVADWLHNLAMFSAHDFEGFDEQWFWREHEHFERKNPEYDLSEYKRVFERVLAGQTGPPYGV